MNFTVIIEAKGMQDKPMKKVGKADNLIFFQAIVRTILKKKKKKNLTFQRHVVYTKNIWLSPRPYLITERYNW